ncbi:MAG: hypothetical protein EOO43_05210 [Flavobacterium sp.]|nr:MAG: hypothetical protein EOO43_05210 [Flavobacterium sp.]
MERSEFLHHYNRTLDKISLERNLTNLKSQDDVIDNNGYWNRLANIKAIEHNINTYDYHFLYEIQGLSSQIHFGIASCILFRPQISTKTGKPNSYNHRYTFMIESTVHCIYSYWNRVALVLNTYLTKPKDVKRIYFASVVTQLLIDYPELEQHPLYNWLFNIKIALEELDRNEFAHNNSLIMQNFLPRDKNRDDFKELLAMPDLLLSHNKAIVDEIYNLVELLEQLEKIYIKNQPR